MDQYTFSLKNKYIHISTTGTYRTYWGDLISHPLRVIPCLRQPSPFPRRLCESIQSEHDTLHHPHWLPTHCVFFIVHPPNFPGLFPKVSCPLQSVRIRHQHPSPTPVQPKHTVSNPLRDSFPTSGRQNRTRSLLVIKSIFFSRMHEDFPFLVQPNPLRPIQSVLENVF